MQFRLENQLFPLSPTLREPYRVNRRRPKDLKLLGAFPAGLVLLKSYNGVELIISKL